MAQAEHVNPTQTPARPRAFILCGGLGTRLRAVVADRPKAMALVAGVPFLQLLIQRLQAQGVREIILGTGYMAEQIEHHFKNGETLGVRIDYSHEDKPLGTGGAVKLAEDKLCHPVLILNGDSYVEWELGMLHRIFSEQEADLVMVLQAAADVGRYGAVQLNSASRIIAFSEKGKDQGPGLINAGVYLMRKDIISQLPVAESVSLERDLFPRLLNGRVFGYVTRGPFIDIGVPEDLHRAQILLAGKTLS